MKVQLIMTLTLTLAWSLNGQEPSEPSAEADRASWINPFASGTFAEWTSVNGSQVGPAWTLTDGIVHRAGKQAGDIITRKQYEDFEMEFEWKISEAGNSGVKYRAHGSLGPEYQVLDDTRHPDRAKPTHRAASLYDLVAAPDDKPLRPVGTWNQARIRAQGTVLEHWLNGVQVSRMDLATPDGQKRLAESKYRAHKDFGRGPGHVLLQDHNDEVWFRNLRIRSLMH